MGIISIYYAIWAQMRDMPLVGRAAIVIAISLIIFNIFLHLIGYRIVAIIILLCNLFCKGFYIIGSKIFDLFILILIRSTTPIERMNQFTSKMERIDIFLKGMAKKLFGKHAIHSRAQVLLYVIIIVLIAIPDILKGHINEAYMKTFSFVADAYSNMEMGAMEKSKEYEPIWISKNLTRETGKGAMDYTDASIASTYNEEEDAGNTATWLSLSKKGKAGTNVRMEPNNDCKVIDVLHDDDKVLFLSVKGGWVNVKLQDGTEGWIREYLLEDIPKE